MQADRINTLQLQLVADDKSRRWSENSLCGNAEENLPANRLARGRHYRRLNVDVSYIIKLHREQIAVDSARLIVYC